tara:strand:+ start:915 stop:1331 length:417 start_codon:yes stop_codon:yes gene_type:complete
MCRRRRKKQQDTTPFNQADIDAALEAERAKAAADASQAVLDQDANAAALGAIQDKETDAQNNQSLDEAMQTMGGAQQSITNIQNQTFQEVKGASEKERQEIRKRKEQQLQRAIRQRRKSGFQGRRSLITGQSGGRGYA